MKSDKSFPLIFKSVSALIPSSLKRKAYFIFFLLILNSFAELFGIATLLPIFSLLLSPDSLHESGILHFMYEFVGFPTVAHFVIFLSLATTLFIVLKNIASMFILRYTAVYTYDIYQMLSIKMYDNFNNRGLKFIANSNSSFLIRDILRSTISFSHRLIWPMFVLISEILLSILILTSIALFIPSAILWVLLGLLPVFYLLYSAAKRYMVRYGKELSEAAPALNDIINQSIFGHTDIVILGKQSYFKDKFVKLLSHVSDITIKESVLSNAPTKIIETFVIIGVVLIFMFGILNNQANAEYISFIGYLGLAAFKLLPSINRVLLAMIDIKNHSFLIDDISRNLETEDPDISLVPVEIATERRELEFNKQIEVENVSFRYNDSSQVLKNITLSIKRGQTIGIIGSSGSGKSTLLKIVLGFLKPQEGKITVDGVQVDKTTMASWRKKLGYVSQEVYLTDNSILDNIVFGEDPHDINLERVYDVLRQVELLDFVNALPENVHTKVGERGGLLSGGQKQRIGIARALYSGAEVLLMDEATSALDNTTEEEITKAIHSLRSRVDCTMIIIAHRYTTLKGCDIIYELKEGSIVKSWSYPELIREKSL